MPRLFVFLLSVGVLGLAGAALAVDLDNNGIQNDETYVPQIYQGNPDVDELVAFPTTADTWQMTYYPYWWNAGDTVYGTHTVPLTSVTHVDLVFKIASNVLNGGGHVDLDFRIGGVTVGSFVVYETDGTGFIYRSFDFAPMVPPFELRYYETNTVASGAGSIVIDESGLCTATFSGESTPAETSSWGRIKGLYR